MADHPIITHERLREVLDYDPITGIFRWQPGHWDFHAGQVAGTVVTERNGYKRINIIIDKRTYKAHRLAWLYMTGEWPNGNIDHRNRDSTDNSWKNLRDDATKSKNAANTALRADNKSGYKGVCWVGSRWKVAIAANGKSFRIGSFLFALDGAHAHDIAAIMIFGEFACPNLPAEIPRSILCSDRQLPATGWRNIEKSCARLKP